MVWARNRRGDVSFFLSKRARFNLNHPVRAKRTRWLYPRHVPVMHAPQSGIQHRYIQYSIDKYIDIVQPLPAGAHRYRSNRKSDRRGVKVKCPQVYISGLQGDAYIIIPWGKRLPVHLERGCMFDTIYMYACNLSPAPVWDIRRCVCSHRIEAVECLLTRKKATWGRTSYKSMPGGRGYIVVLLVSL